MRLRWEFSWTRFDRSRKIITWSFLLRRLIWSLGFGFEIYLNIDLPFSLFAHELSHSILVLDLSICFTVACDTGFGLCSLVAPFFARVSALSLPGMLQWLGIHCMNKVTEKCCISNLVMSDRGLEIYNNA